MRQEIRKVDGAGRVFHPWSMSLMSRFSKSPIPFDKEQARDVLAAYQYLPENAHRLLEGTAGCSPYLRGLLLRHQGWLQENWQRNTGAILASIREDVQATTFEGLAFELRRAKQRIALVVALSDLGGVWSLSQVTSALTRFADFAVQTALDHLIAAEIKRGKLPGCVAADAHDACGIAVLAMGKMGAFELNYSSDIDLIVLFDETRHPLEHRDSLRAGFIRITRRMCKMLSEVTRDGYVFRTDLRLRPDPAVTPVCLSMGAAMRYYESLGRTWERAAFVKARVCAGDQLAGKRFLTALRPFVWRKHLDFAAIEDAHDMRLRIREHKRLGGPITLSGHNLKLGRGGIREIEFFTQTRQIIAGGRDPDLQVSGTVEGLEQLAKKGWISESTAQALGVAYAEFRTLEHRLQMISDTQTHDLPKSDSQFQRLANFCGQHQTQVFKSEITATLEMVHNLTETFFNQDRGQPPVEGAASLGTTAQKLVARWPDYPALRSARAGVIFKRLQPIILNRLDRAANPAEALIQLDGFLSGLPSGVQLFSMFEANPHLIDLLVDICATTPSLARYLSRNPGVLDAVIGGSFFDRIPGEQMLAQDLRLMLDSAADYEGQLNTARRWLKEMRFRVGVMHLQGHISAIKAAGHYSDLAGACLCALNAPVCDAFSARHGVPPGKGAIVLGMGSLGAGSLTATSDLDLIVIYDAEDMVSSDGPRPLPVSTYFSRFTQALVTAISSPMADGRLYEVDMRLRPSGRKGPVATAFHGFKAYQKTKAWSWEHLALTRARVVAGAPELAAKVEGFRTRLIKTAGDGAKTLLDVKDMRSRLAEASDAGRVASDWEFKMGAGRGQDIELLASAAALVFGSASRQVTRQLRQCVKLGWCSASEVRDITAAYIQLQKLGQVTRLVTDQHLDPEVIGQGACEFLLRETGHRRISDLQSELRSRQKQTARIIDRVFGRSG